MENNSWISAPVIWFILGLIIFLFEFANPGFIFFFFGLGAWVVAVICMFADIKLFSQLVIFLATSVFLLILLRKKFTELFKGFRVGKDNPAENIDDFTGKLAKVTETINPPERGKVELYGSNWIAVADEKIEAGKTVEIIKKDNIILFVKQVS